MKVGDSRSSEQAKATNREGDKRQEKAQGDKSRSFSDLLGAREDSKSAFEGRMKGDEKGQLLKEGLVQKEGRQEDARLQRRHDDRGGSARAMELKSGKNEGGEKSEREGLDGEKREISKGAERRREIENGESGPLIREAGGVAAEAEKAMESQSAERATSSPAVEEIAKQIVDAVRIGEDSQARRVVFLDVTVPGQGNLRIRLRQDGGGMEVRMRADNDALARSVRENVEGLRHQTKELGVNLTSIRVVR